MGVEVAGSDLNKVNGEAKPKLHDIENGKVNVAEPITFGSHGFDEQQPKGEAKIISNANLPKDAVEEWAEPQIHPFWFVKYRPIEDLNLKAKLDQTDKEIQKKNLQITQIIDFLKAKRAERYELIAELKSLGAENSQYWAVINEKREEMRPLQSALGTLRGGGTEKGFGICSSEEELNQLIRSLEYQMQHESLSLKEEKQLLREIKELEATRPKVMANSAMRAKIQESMGQKEAIQDQVKNIGTDLDGVRKQKAVVKAKMDHLSEQVNALDCQIKALQDDLEDAKEKKKTAVETIQQLRKKRDEGNAYFYQSRTVLNNAKELAAKKDVKTLEELAYAEVEKFMSQWNSSKAFRGDYEKRILTSLDMRQLSRDGRMRNFDEKPLVTGELPRPETEVAPKATPKPQKEGPKTTPKAENLPVEKGQKEPKKGSKESKIVPKQADEEEEIFVVEKPKKDVSKDNEIDAAKLKEMKKEEEKEKQRQALERKKKLQEKAAAKTALRAQKEAEKKQKEREKKLKKKEASTAQPTNEEEPEKPEEHEPEKSDDVEEAVETPVPWRAKDQKENNALRRRKPIKTRGTLPKAIPKKKKSANYWIWASAAAAVVVVLMLLVLGYKYLF